MNSKNKFWELNLVVFLVLSLIFVVPLNLGLAFADEHGGEGALSFERTGPITRDEVKSSVCGIPFNVKDSLVMSVVTLCIPGILEKAHEWKDQKCQLVVCKYEAIKNELDPSFCDKQDAYNTCKFIVGEIFAIPPFSIVDKIRQIIADFIADPIGYLFAVGVSFYRKSVAACAGAPDITPTCNVAYSIPLGIIDTLAGIQRLKSILDNGFNYFTPGIEYCDQIEDIKIEMESIIRTLNNEDRLARGGS